MSGIGSTLRKYWVEIAWGAFGVANVIVIFALTNWETVPFHFIWVSLTLLYGFSVWQRKTTAFVLVVVILTTGAALVWVVIYGQTSVDEVTEVLLMASLFLVMAWHAESRQRAVEEAERAAATVHRVLDRQRDFVRDASHELRTPITVARGHAELLRASAAAGGQTARDADVILDELGRLSRLSDRLITLAAADHPGFLVMETLSIQLFVKERIHRWSPTARRDWCASVDATGSVQGDHERLDVAIDALIENAVRATADGGRIELKATAEGSTLILQVIDDGSGIATHDLPHVFEPFSRRERDRARGSGGTGLGLAIVKAIAEAHGGTVDVASAVGVGTTFRIRLPRYVAPTAREPGPVSATATR